MFSLFGKSDKPVLTDKVWKTQAACLKGMVAEALTALKNGATPVIVFYFEEDGRKLIDFISSNKIPSGFLDFGHLIEASRRDESVILVEASRAGSNESEWLLRRSKISPLLFFFQSHYPLPSVESELIDKLKAKLGSLSIVFCLSLEDPVMEVFGSDKIKPMMDALGMGDDDYVQHAMVGKAIQRAREKLAEKVGQETRTKSQAEWFSKNLKSV